MADEPVVDGGHPVAQQMAEPLDVVAGDELAPGRDVAILDRVDHQPHRAVVGRQLGHDLGELARVRLLLAHGRRARELETEDHGLLAAQPMADDLAVLGELVALQQLRHRLAVVGAERVDRGPEDLLVLRQRRHHVRTGEYFVEQRSILICHRKPRLSVGVIAYWRDESPRPAFDTSRRLECPLSKRAGAEARSLRLRASRCATGPCRTRCSRRARRGRRRRW